MADGTLIFDTDLDTNGLSTGLGKVGNVAGTAFKGVAVAAGAAATAVGFVAKGALDGYAAFEQLTGGVETLFKDSSGAVMQYAENAYKTAGMSANAYMETVTSFSASLIQSLDGDTAEAAKVADMAITDMSDNANKMGTSIDMIQNAYNGFAKGNFTMLDNLKLGYGGTQEEMKRLLEDATAISGIEYDISSFADVAEAIHVIQTEIGITGTTAAEASSTIEGSTASMKAAWENLLTGIADDDADLNALIDQFVNSIVVAGENILPRIGIILNGIGDLISNMLPVIMEMVPTIINDTLPRLIESGLQIVMQLASGIAGALPELIPVVIDTILMIIDTIIENLPMLIDAALAIIVALAGGLIMALPELLAKVPEIVVALVNAFNHLMNRISEIGSTISGKVRDGIANAWSKVTGAVSGWISSLKSKFIESVENFTEIGSNIVTGIWNGIKSGWDWLTNKVKSLASGLLSSVKGVLGIASPSKEFKYIGEMCVAGFDDGIEDLVDGDAITRGINASVNTIGANTSASSPRVGGFNQTINVNKEVGTPDELARVVRLESRYGLMKGVAFA